MTTTWNPNKTVHIKDIRRNFIDSGYCSYDNTMQTIKSNPYGPPKCNQFAVINRPEVNPYLGRGCDANNPNGVCDRRPNLLNFRDPTVTQRIIQNDAPGGLADPRTDMDTYQNFSKYIHNGFILDNCECLFDTQVKERCSDTKYSVSNDCKSPPNCDKDRVTNVCRNTKCDSLSGNFSVSSFSPGQINEGLKLDPNKNTAALSGDVWNSNENPTCTVIYQDLTTSKGNFKSNCSQYIEKWAKTCKWCKDLPKVLSEIDNRLYIPNPDVGSPCSSDSDCYGTTPGRCSGGKCDNAKEPYPMECKICDSEIWDYVPGGWEAVVDPTNPKHTAARLAYVAKFQETKNKHASLDADQYYVEKTSSSSGNLEDILNSSFLDFLANVPDKDANFYGNRNATCDAGSYTRQVWNGYQHDYSCNEYMSDGKVINKPTQALAPKQYGFWSWDNRVLPIHNQCGEICTGDAANEWLGPKDQTVQNVWDTIGSSPNPDMQYLKPCSTTNTLYPIFGDIQYESKPASARLMCQRNPQLTGQGLYDISNDNPTKSNYHIAMNWVTGYLDLSDYLTDDSGTQQKKKYFNDLETRQHLLEALRCCNGLAPNEKYDRTHCMPASTCASNKFCIDIHKMIPELPDYDPYVFAMYPSIDWNTLTSDRPENYLKMYCELMAKSDVEGGIKSTKPYDSDIEILCRKAMFDYASESVGVSNGQPQKYQMGSYKLPLRVFDDSVIEWCKTNKGVSRLSDSLPSQKGSCDVLLGRACQQLQSDGWISPENFSKSELLATFTTDPECNSLQENDCKANNKCKWNTEGLVCEGTWVEKDNPLHTHSLSAKKIQNVCSCFLLGAECLSGNCSYTYCGAGTNCENLKDQQTCESEKCTWDSSGICKNPINMEVDVNNKTLPKWYSTFNKNNLTCGTNNGKGVNCYTNCNYVNSYDVCWNAGPDERKGPILDKRLTEWKCAGNNCESVDGKYTCIGSCSTDQQGYPNCGTNTWFSQNVCSSLINEQDCSAKIECKWDPSESTCKTLLKPVVPNMKSTNPLANISNWDAWQNYYVQTVAGQKPTSGTVPGIGFMLFVRDSNKIKYCNSGKCDILNPENVIPSSTVGNDSLCQDVTCNINQNINVTNTGKIVGNLVMTNETYAKCQLTYNSPLNATDPEVRKRYINYMGDVNNCTDNCDKSKICIDVATGDNCSKCQDLGAKSNMCCISQDLFTDTKDTKICFANNSLNKSDVELCSSQATEADCTSTNEKKLKCKWGSEGLRDNNSIVNVVGSKINYLCQETCPSGSVDVTNLANSCSNSCPGFGTQEECMTCKYCKWNSGKCEYSCPLQSTNVRSVRVDQNPPATPVTSPPTIRPTLPPEEELVKTAKELAIIIVPSVVGLVLFIICCYYLWRYLTKK